MVRSRTLKWALWAIGTAAAVCVATVVLFIWLVSWLAGEPSKDEVARVTAPNEAYDAVLFETNGGATTSFGYEIYVVEHGAKPTGAPAVFLYGAIRNPNSYGANLKWVSPRLLAVEFLNAKSKKIPHPSVSMGGQSVDLAIREGIVDSSAPSGGMLYKLQGR